MINIVVETNELLLPMADAVQSILASENQTESASIAHAHRSHRKYLQIGVILVDHKEGHVICPKRLVPERIRVSNISSCDIGRWG